MRRSFERAIGRSLIVDVYTDDMFATMNDADNRAAVAAVATADLVLAGFAAAGPAKQVDKAFDKIKLHPDAARLTPNPKPFPASSIPARFACGEQVFEL